MSEAGGTQSDQVCVAVWDLTCSPVLGHGTLLLDIKNVQGAALLSKLTVHLSACSCNMDAFLLAGLILGFRCAGDGRELNKVPALMPFTY